MELKFTKEEMIKVIEDYYQKKENKKVIVKIKSEKAIKGYGMGEYETCFTIITIEEDVTILGRVAKKTENIKEEKLLEMFNSLLEDSEYEATRLTIEDGVSRRTVGYFMDEHDVVSPYCKGVTLSVKTKGKQKTIGGI